jgi:hypothetical protein
MTGIFTLLLVSGKPSHAAMSSGLGSSEIWLHAGVFAEVLSWVSKENHNFFIG